MHVDIVAIVLLITCVIVLAGAYLLGLSSYIGKHYPRKEIPTTPIPSRKKSQ